MGEIKRLCAATLAASCLSILLTSRAQAQAFDGKQVFYTEPANYNSYLVGYGANPFSPGQGEISSTQFSNWINTALDPGGVPDVKDADFFFQECYRGGMMTNLIPALGTVPWVGASASSWWQVALVTATSTTITTSTPIRE
jgi:hypothetical protein